MPKLRHYDNEGTARFVTFNCYRELPYLLLPNAKELLTKHINAAREKHNFKLFGYVFMPEHVHLVMLSAEGTKLGLLIREIKSKMAREYFAINMSNTADKNVFWQKRCYDHNCRSIDSMWEKINYCHNNPVKRGLVSEPGEYEWSSFNWYTGKRDVPLRIDEIEN